MSTKKEVYIFILIVAMTMSLHYLIVSVLNLPEDAVLLRGSKVDL
jgi:hypothetical protein